MRLSNLVWPLLALALLMGFNFFFTPNFFHIEMKDGHLYGYLADILNRVAPVLLLSLGMTLVIATGGVDLSVGAVMAIAAAVAGVLLGKDYSAGVAIAGAFGAALLAGLLNGALVAGIGIQPIVATLILMVAGRGVAQLITDGQILTIDNKSFEYLGSGFLVTLPFTITLSLAAFLLTFAVTRGTALGLLLEAVGGNSTASKYSGVSVGSVKLAAYAFSGLCAGLAGMITAADIKAADANTAGMYLELDAILAVVIGGTALTGGRFSLAGSMLGAILMQALTTTILARGIAVEFTLVVKAIVILVVCLLQSEALRARFKRRRKVVAAA